MCVLFFVFAALSRRERTRTSTFQHSANGTYLSSPYAVRPHETAPRKCSSVRPSVRPSFRQSVSQSFRQSVVRSFVPHHKHAPTARTHARTQHVVANKIHDIVYTTERHGAATQHHRQSTQSINYSYPKGSCWLLVCLLLVCCRSFVRSFVLRSFVCSLARSFVRSFD